MAFDGGQLVFFHNLKTLTVHEKEQKARQDVLYFTHVLLQSDTLISIVFRLST